MSRKTMIKIISLVFFFCGEELIKSKYLAYNIQEVIKLNISLKELQTIPNPNIIDIRTVENYNNNHMPGAINIPYNNLLITPGKYLNKNEKYYIYCKHGKTSNGLCHMLNSLGFNTYSIKGGYEAWILSKYNEQ